jgi:L-2-hydroxyglutarate oxidase
MNTKSDFLIIGAGVIGLAVANELLERNRNLKVTVIDKEQQVALHASGRNSGVLHAGFYYSPDSLKAKLTRDGNRLLKEFCTQNSIPFKTTGKVVVAKNGEELAALQTLLSRGIANGVEVEEIDEKQLEEIEPWAKTFQKAIWSPSTAVANPSEVVIKMAEKFVANGGTLQLETEVKSITNNSVSTNRGDFSYAHLINASGLYADKIAKQMGFASKYTMLPFIGLYFYAPSLKGKMRSHIYPVPDARNPFLGVHLTTTITGDVKVGPTAIPVVSREQYSPVSGFSFSEFIEIIGTYPSFIKSDHHDVWSLFKTEFPKLSRKHLVEQASSLVHELDQKDFSKRGKPGIRAQLFDLNEKRLEMDFVIEGDSNSTHLLNAVSPAWTSSISFAKYVVDQLSERKVL